jgi:hypothetical protein
VCGDEWTPTRIDDLYVGKVSRATITPILRIVFSD